MDLNVWLILTLICTASGTTPWRTGPPDNSLSTIPETTADQTELVPFTAIVTDDTTPYSKVTTPSYGTEAHTSPQTTDNSLSTIPETTADQTELVTDKDDTTPYSKVKTPSYGTGTHTSPHTPVTTPSYLTELDTSTYTHTSVVTDSDDTTPYSKVTTPSYGTQAPISPQTPVTTPSYGTQAPISPQTPVTTPSYGTQAPISPQTPVTTPSYGTQAPISPQTPVTTPSYGTEAPISPQTPAWPPLTTQQPAQDENVTLVIGEMQTIMSPNYPSNYPNDALYNWYITAISGYDVLFHFQNFYLQSNYDYLRIGTGDSATSPGSVEVVSLTGSSLPSDIRLFMLYKPTCWMKFTSNSLYTYQGFQLQLSIINSTSDEMIWLNIEDTENISSPNYPLNYDDNTEYNWYITAPPGYDMLVHFLDFYIQANYDYLLIGSGDSAASPESIKLYSLTAYSLPSDRRIYGPTGWITFTSNTGTNNRGFELQLTLINSTLGGYCEECCECGDVIGCNCDSACQSRDDCCYDYTPHCSQVRLVQSRDSGYNYASGSVEVFANGIWGTVCDHEWDLKDGHVVCRSMGFKRAFGVFYNAYFGQGTGNIHLDNVNCTGREPSIQNCSHDGLGVHDCTHADDAGVGCSTYSDGYCQGCCDCGFIESGTCFCDVSCQEYDDCCMDYESFCSEVHLRNGSTYIEGRVEVFADGVWGTVCDDFWDINDAKVICKSMGFPGVEGAFSGAAFGEGTGNITLDNVNCTGEESSILSCPNDGLGVHDCSHADDAGVRCSLTNDENVSLIFGKAEELTSPNYPGMSYDNTVYNWLITAPSGFHVLIRFLYMSLQPCRDLVTIGTGDSPTSSDSVQLASLSGYEEPSDIRLYTPTGWIQFTSDESVISYGFRLELIGVDSTAAPARLVNGSYPNEGRVEVYNNSLGTWGTICDYGWDTMDATVICRSIGYPDAVSSYGSALFGMGSGPILLNDVDCEGDEDNIFYCPYESGDIDYCTHYEDAGAMCYPNVRLVNGSSSSEGRVEVYHDGMWGTVCDNNWGSPESRVLCRSLGFPDALESLPNAYFGEGTVDLLLMVSYCNGDENSIFDCCHYGIGYNYCGHDDDVGVRCQPNVRLVDGGSSNEGRVEVYHGETWGTVCDNEWGMDEARVICKSLGYPDALQAFGNASFGQGTGDILLDEVDCFGNESSIFYCYHGGVGVTSCSHQDDAGVRCSTGVTTPSYLTEFDTSTYTQTSVTDSDDTTPYSKVTTPSYGTEAPISPQTPAWPPWTTQQPVQDENVTLVIGENQTIMSPNYPSNYPNDAIYNWYITAISGYDVLFHFLNFYLQSNYDYLRIGTGDSATSPESVEVVSLSGYSLPSDIRLFMLYKPTCWMQFTSNYIYTYQGFQLQLSIINSTSDEMLSLNFGDTKNTSSPNYPLNYDDNTEYTWYIAAPPGYDILVHFLDFYLETSYDYLLIGSGDSAASPGSIRLYLLTGYSLPSDRRIYGPTGWMTLTTDSSVTYRGFELQLTLINSTVGGYCEECCECGDVIGCHCDSACQSRGDCCHDYTPHCSQGENVTLVVGETQNITSPNYPSNYTNNAYYNWYITAPPGNYVLIHFLDFNTESCCDYLKIGTGDSPTSNNSVQLASLSGSSLPLDIRLMTPTSWMKFTSNSNITDKGFQLEMSVYEAIEDETTAWTSITSLFYTVTSDPETTRDFEDETTASTTTNIPTTSESSIPLPIIGAVTLVSLLVVAIVIVICVCLVCRKKRRMHMEEGLLDDDVFQPDYIELSPTPKTKKKNVIHKNRVSRPVLLANIETHYDWLKADSEHRLMEEYDDIQAVGSIVRMDQATNAEVNKTKNRFNKILPYEHSRVKLMALKGKSETDYINANYIPGFNSPREYIACQGPLPETTNDMWRMIWEKKSTIIVMMTKTVEGGKDKCHQYWPKKKGRSDTYGGSLEVSLQSELDYEHWITRTFMLQKNKMKREVIQLQFTSWPDHGVPEQTKPMLDFVKNVRERIRNKCVIKPLIVHCSAGVGRTGTYIALDRLTQHMEDNDFVDVCGVVCEMRMHRNYLVQTETQYIFIHDCLMDYFCSGVTP